MTTTATTIHDVWIYTKQRRRKPDVFDLSLSPAGVVVLRPGRTAQRLGWDRISEWEIEKRQGYLLLTLRGGGSTTRLVITGWSVEELDSVIQQAMAGSAAPAPPATRVAPVAGTPRPPVERADSAESKAEARAPDGVPEVTEREEHAEPLPPEPAWRQLRWKPVVTVVLLGVLAFAVIVVLLQSAGAINWGFLGPNT